MTPVCYKRQVDNRRRTSQPTDYELVITATIAVDDPGLLQAAATQRLRVSEPDDFDDELRSDVDSGDPGAALLVLIDVQDIDIPGALITTTATVVGPRGRRERRWPSRVRPVRRRRTPHSKDPM